MRIPLRRLKPVVPVLLFKYILLFVILFAFAENSHAQSSIYQYSFDSLQKELRKKKTDAEKIQIIDWLLEATPEVDTEPSDSIYGYLDQMIALQKRNDP